MLLTKNIFKKVSLVSFAVFSLFSCSKDADLLSEYVIADKNELESIALLVDDSFFISNGQPSILLDVLNNDTFESGTQVNIVSTSLPKNGSVVINDNNTLTYTPQIATPIPVDTTPIETTPVETTPVEDTFTYTTEVTTNESEVLRQEATVTISTAEMGELLAFPGAEGFGKYTTGGRGGVVIHVTNLNDSGSGSLREALERKGRRTIVFDVGGDINLLSPITIGGTDFAQNTSLEGITIAGETAPFPGITIKNNELYFHVGNVIVRYLTFRSKSIAGDNANSPNCIKVRNWGVGGYIMDGMMFDHLTMSHAGNENFGTYADNSNAPLINFTLQNSMIGNLNSGDGNMLIGPNNHNITIYQNYLHHTERRNPLIGYGYNNPNEKKEFINNIVYGGLAASGASYGNVVDFISNIYKSTSNMQNKFGAYSWGEAGYIAPEDAVEGDGLVHYSGNFPSGPLTSDSNGVYYGGTINTYNEASRVVTNSLLPTFNTIKSDIENAVLPTVGNSLFRESLEQTLIDDYYAGTGNYSIPNIPTKTATSRAASYDTDNDGMADAWERAIFGDLSKSANGDENGDGYTNLETFFYSLTQ